MQMTRRLAREYYYAAAKNGEQFPAVSRFGADNDLDAETRLCRLIRGTGIQRGELTLYHDAGRIVQLDAAAKRQLSIAMGKIWQVCPDNNPDNILFEGSKTACLKWCRDNRHERNRKRGIICVGKLLWENGPKGGA